MEKVILDGGPAGQSIACCFERRATILGIRPDTIIRWKPDGPTGHEILLVVESPKVSFVAGVEGEWEIVRVVPVRGGDLRAARRLARLEGPEFTLPGPSASWTLDGVRSNERYTESREKKRLAAVQPSLGRPEATLATLIPMRKSAAWWGLAQDERRAIFEARSHHIALGLEYLPAIARRLYHCRDLGGEFDFLTWFEYAPSDAPAFAELVSRLRAAPEWEYVEREVEVHCRHAPPTVPARRSPSDL